jgi:polyhydroxyalkanoate synthesis regulator phasin
MSEAVVSEEFAKTMGRYLEGYMEAVIPQQQLIKQAMEQQLQQMNVPSRPEILTLAERLTHLEMRVDDLDAKMDEILDRLEAIQATLSASQIVGGVNGFSSSQAGPKQ